MVWKILRAPVVFFDSHEIGTILTRFSKDIHVTDYMFPFQLNSLLSAGFRVIMSVIFIIVAIPYNAITLGIVFIPMYILRKKQRLALLETQRIESSSKGPVNTKFSSAINGLKTIRAYNRTGMFIDQFMKGSDHNASAKFTYHAVARWLGIRLNLIGYTFV